jgi:fermentation-respiration switch protein FrsA (DUF1100 family)
MNFAGNLHILWVVLRICLLAYLGLCLVMFIFQARYVYFPTREILATPKAFAMPFEQVAFTASDGTRLAAWFVPADSARGTALICHGNGGNIGDRLPIIRLFHDLGLNVFIFDYRGYGESQGTPSEEGTYADALAAWNYLVAERGLPPDRIIVCGRSLGGAVAAWLADKHPPAGLVLEASFTSLTDVAAKVYFYLPVRFLCRFRYPTLEHLRKVRCPVLVAHSRDDGLIPFVHGQKLFAAAPEPKVFVELTGDHNEGEECANADYRRTLEAFLARCLGGGGQL